MPMFRTSKNNRRANSDSSSPQHTQLPSWDEEPKLIYRLISSKMWQQLRAALKSQPGSDSSFFRPVVHFACRFQCPLEIIQLLDEKFPHSTASVDNMGKWPIHYAAEFGAPCGIIKYLAEKDPRAAGAQDIAGMTPTHYLCRYYVARHQPKRDGERPTKHCMLDAMKILVQTAPSSLNLEDEDGMNAIEYAIDSEADLKVVRTLQKGCEKQWKKERHDHISQRQNVENRSPSTQPTEQSTTNSINKTKTSDFASPRLALLCASQTQSRSNRAIAA